jgi:DNA-nicking Smr family endonuclease
MTKPKKPDTEEIDIFRKAMQGVKPLTHTKVTTEKKRLIPKRPAKIFDESEEGFAFSDYERLDPVKTEDFLEFSRSGVQDKVLRKMRQGQYNAEAILDLHGKTAREACESLSHFLLQCQHQDVRHILIIHGKGRDNDWPVLKNKLNNWLRQTEQVIAFCTAGPKHGGNGALYVLLRRKH